MAKDHDGIGDKLRVIAHHGDHMHTVRERDGEIIGAGLARPCESAADLVPGAEVAEPCGDGTYRVTGRIPGGGQVATPAYRDSWERTFGGKVEVGKA